MLRRAGPVCVGRIKLAEVSRNFGFRHCGTFQIMLSVQLLDRATRLGTCLQRHFGLSGARRERHGSMLLQIRNKIGGGPRLLKLQFLDRYSRHRRRQNFLSHDVRLLNFLLLVDRIQLCCLLEIATIEVFRRAFASVWDVGLILRLKV